MRIKVWATRENGHVQLWGEQPHRDPKTKEWLGMECITVQVDPNEPNIFDHTPPGKCVEMWLDDVKFAVTAGYDETAELMFGGV